MSVLVPPPVSAEGLLSQISEQYAGLSKQLKSIGRYVEAHREGLALTGIQEVAAACAVQPSAVVRFAKHFGFSGFSEMQKLFREAISEHLTPGRSYQARIRDAISADAPLTATAVARRFLTGSVASVQALAQTLERSDIDRAVGLLAATETIWLVGMRRSFPVASYLEYALQHTEKRVLLVDALGAMQEGQMRSVRAGDVLLAVSFAPYAAETQAVTQLALQRGAQVIALTDSRMSPLAEGAAAVLLAQDGASFGFRSLSGAISLAQSLFVALAYQLELNGSWNSTSPGPSENPSG